MNTCIETLNRFGGQLSGFVWPMLWQSSLLIILVFALDFLLARKIRASVRYALWLAVLVKLLLPPTFAFPTGVSWWLFQPKMAVKARATGNYVITYGAITPQPDFSPTTISLPAPAPPMLNGAGWMLLASGGVSTGLLLWRALRWWQVGRMVRRAAVSEEFSETIEAAGRLADWGSRVRLKLVERQMSPAVCGLVRPVVLLPRALAKSLSAPQLRAVVLHEIFHLRRMDVWVNCAQTSLQIVYWWHPLLWIANARIRRLREEAVDDAVMLALREESDSYAPTLLEVAKLALRRPLLSLGLVGILESRGTLRQRIERLVEFRAPRKAGLTFASLCGIFAFSAVALPMGEAPAPAPTEQQVEVKLAAPALPAVRESTNRVPVLVEAQFYEMPAGAFKDLVSGLQFKPGVKNEDSWWSVSKENFSTLQTALTKAGFHLLTKPRVQTRSGIAADLYCGNGTNGVWFNCMPTVEGNIVDLSVDGKVMDGRQQVVSTNHFRAIASAENDGGMVIRIDRMDGLETSNLVVVIGVELITNTPPVHLQQRLQAVIKRADVANSPAAAGSTNQLFVRTFKIDTRAFIAGLKQAGAALDEETNSPAHIARAVRKFIGGLGVDWDLPAGKSCFFNDRNGLLFVRATESDLDLVERAVQILDYMEPQIHIKARFWKCRWEPWPILAVCWYQQTPRSISSQGSSIQRARQRH